MKTFEVFPIGTVRQNEGGAVLELNAGYAAALQGLEGFSHIQLLWWFDKCGDGRSRATLQEQRPYAKGPGVLGTFATRSPMRPNPIALSVAQVTYVDAENGRVGLAWLDADDGTPVLDVKPYTPSMDRVEQPKTPGWCAHWPQSVEASGAFDWGAEFNF